MRLIDADALWEIFREKQNSLTARCGGYRFLGGEDRAKYDRLEITLAYIENAPEVDAAPVVRGEWVVDECDTTDDVPSSSWIDFHCSECTTDYGLEEGQYGWCRYEKIPYQYCPNCGAKMESEGGT